MIVDSLVLALGLDAKGVQSGLQNVSNEVKRTADQMDAALSQKARGMANNFSSVFRNILAPVMGALSFGAAFNQYTAGADAVGKLSDALEVDIEDLQAWGEAATRAGGSSAAFQGSLQSFNKLLQVSAQNANDATAKMLTGMGIAVKDASGKARDALSVMRDLAGAAENMSKAEFKGLAEKLRLDRGTIMLLQQGRKGLDELIARQKELGVYTKEDAEITARFNDAFADLGQVIRAASAQILRVLTPAITFLTEKMTGVVKLVRENVPLVMAALGTISAFLTAKFAPAAIKAMAPFIPFMAILAGVALVLDDLYAYMNGGNSVFAEFWSAFGTGEEIQQAVNEAWKSFKEIVSQVWEVLKPYVPMLAKLTPMVLILGGAFGALGKVTGTLSAIASGIGLITKAVRVMSLAMLTNPVGLVLAGIAVAVYLAIKNWDKLKETAIKVADAIKEKWQAVKQFFSDLWDKITAIFDSAVTAIKNLFAGNTGAELFKGAWEGVSAFFKGLWDSVTGIFQTGYNAVMAIWNALMGAIETGVKFVKSAWETLTGIAGGVKEAVNFYSENSGTDWEEVARDTAMNFQLKSADSIPPAAIEETNDNRISNETHINKIEVNAPQATDANGVAAGIGGALERQSWGSLRSFALSSQTGTVQK